jgi:hypothetical protein
MTKNLQVAKLVNVLPHLFLKILASSRPGKSRITHVIQMVRYNWIPSGFLGERFLQLPSRGIGSPDQAPWRLTKA